MDVGLMFTFLSKFWEIVKVHLITLSGVLHSHNIQFSMEGRCRSSPKCPKVLGAKRGRGRNGCWFAVQSRKWPFWKINLRTNKKSSEKRSNVDVSFEQINIKCEQRQLLRCYLNITRKTTEDREESLGRKEYPRNVLHHSPDQPLRCEIINHYCGGWKEKRITLSEE